tara:strand:- start:30870 stop:32132 length:1263 start_codon:yes stop_codon:yes gene_type:complete
MKINKQRESCGVCKNKDLEEIINFGKVPLAGDFPNKSELKQEGLSGLRLLLCERCGLLQTDTIIDPSRLFSDYRYKSSIGLAKHFKGLADLLVKRFSLNETSNVLDIGSNDNPLLKPLKELGVKHVNGIDPATNIVDSVKEDGIAVINDFFGEATAKKHYTRGVFDLITCNNCFAHIEDLNSVVRGLKYCLKEGGDFVFEVAYVKDTIDQLQWPNIYHEHIYYHSLTDLVSLFNMNGMTVVDFDEIPIHSGSIRVYVKNDKSSIVPRKVMTRLYKEQIEWKITSKGYMKEFSKAVRGNAQQLLNLIGNIKAIEKKRIVGYGASGRANMICNASHINTFMVDYIVDESPEREGRFTSKTHIPIVKKSKLDNDDPDYIILFASNFAKMIMEKLKDRNFKYIIPFPKWTVIESIDELENYNSI